MAVAVRGLAIEAGLFFAALAPVDLIAPLAGFAGAAVLMAGALALVLADDAGPLTGVVVFFGASTTFF